MAKTQITAVDIGTNSIKVLQLELTPAGIVIVNSGVESYPRQSAAEKVSDEAIIDILNQLISDKGFKTKPVAMAVPRHSITVKSLAGLPASATDEDIDKMVPIQVETELPFAIADAVYSAYNLQRSPEGVALEVVAAKRPSVERYIYIAGKTGLKLKAIIPSSFATYAVVFDQFKEQLAGRTVAIADAGAGMTDICIIQHGRLAFSRSFTFGGNNLTQAFEQEYKLSFQAAEQQKINKAALWSNTEDSLTGRWAQNLGRQIAQSLRAFTGEETTDGIDSLWLCGGSSLVPGLDRYLADRLGIEVTLWNPLQKMEDQSLGEELQRGLSVPLGLGIIGAAGEKKAPTVNANLLPKEIREREERARRKVAALAATALAILVLAAAGLGFTSWRRSRAALYERAFDRLQVLEQKDKTRNAKAALENSILMQQMMTPYVTPLEVLRELSERLPERGKMALTSFNIDKKGKITMGVEAASYADASDVIQILSEVKILDKAELFGEIKHGTISKVTKEKRPIFQVQLVCELNKDAVQELR